MNDMRTLNVELTSHEYGELLGKLANELEDYGDSATPSLQSVFMKMVRSNLFEDVYESTLMKKWKEVLSTATPN